MEVAGAEAAGLGAAAEAAALAEGDALAEGEAAAAPAAGAEGAGEAVAEAVAWGSSEAAEGDCVAVVALEGAMYVCEATALALWLCDDVGDGDAGGEGAPVAVTLSEGAPVTVTLGEPETDGEMDCAPASCRREINNSACAIETFLRSAKDRKINGKKT